MSKQTIEINDCLPDRVECAIDEVKEALLNYLIDNPDTDELPCLNNDLDYNCTIHEIVDGSVPIYTHDIKSAWFLHDSELEEAYNNAGVGDNPRENDGMAAIYFYIFEAVNHWYQTEAEDVFQEWKEKQEKM